MGKRKIRQLVLFLIVLSTLVLSIPALANVNLPSISRSKPILTFTYNSTGKVYRYKDSTLKTKYSDHWIDCAKDECKIIEIRDQAVLVIYPTSKGDKEGWFNRSDFCKGDLTKGAQCAFKANKKIITYKWKGNNTQYGYISNGDKCYLLRGNQNSDWLQVLYPISGGYKMAWVKGADIRTVIWPVTTKITLNTSSVTLTSIGSTTTLKATVTPSNSSQGVSWSSSNSSVATVSGGTVKAVGAGTATITATSGSKKATATVNVVVNTSTEIVPSKITISPDSITLNKGQTKTLSPTVSPSNAKNKSVTWKSNNTGVAKVSSNGKVTPVSNGTATITASTFNGKTATCKVTVKGMILSQSEIDRAASAYKISKSSNAYKALMRINSKYANHSNITSSDLKKPLIFLFEGVGNSSSTSKRNNAMCVVVKKGKIAYIGKNCSTIPDHPFEPKYNGGKAMPTLKSGVYCYVTKNHRGKYAALGVRGTKSSSDAPVLRFSSKKKYKSDTSPSINVHYRDSTNVSNSNPPSSQGCQTILKSDYLNFCKAVGILKSSRKSITTCDSKVTGKIIIDRNYAKNYLKSVGYPSGALDYLK